MQENQEMWFNPWVRKIPWSRNRKQQPTPVILPGKFHGHRSLAGYCPWGQRRVRLNWATEHTHMHRTSIKRKSISAETEQRFRARIITSKKKKNPVKNSALNKDQGKFKCSFPNIALYCPHRYLYTYFQETALRKKIS